MQADVQTFLPFPDFAASVAVLDDRRLGKQRVEAYQMLRALTFPRYAWKNHPAVRMWRGFVPALVAYGVASCEAWTARGYGDRVRESLLTFTGGVAPAPAQLRRRGQLPPWLGMRELHDSHQSALLRKAPEHYRELFPRVAGDLPYVWPSSCFPRWPLRRPVQGAVTPLEALRACGFDTARPGQLEAAQAIREGRDALLCMPAGVGSTVAGLMAAMTVAGPCLWVTPRHQWPAEDPVSIPLPELIASRPATRRKVAAALTARPPTPEDLAAIAEEIAAPREHLYFDAHDLRCTDVAAEVVHAGVGLIVVEKADALAADEATELTRLRGKLPHVPLLAFTRSTRPRKHRDLLPSLPIREPVLVNADTADRTR